ncbi:hypothetical protein SBV1_950022 [Verrucomicrobia bacterium]|nr:hypothetical protein SBV1_950022 [Verrucomicrobiota bacterium]
MRSVTQDGAARFVGYFRVALPGLLVLVPDSNGSVWCALGRSLAPQKDLSLSSASIRVICG